jgi:hypothetical protein
MLSIAPPHQQRSSRLKSSSGHACASTSGGLPWSQEKAQRSRTSGSISIGRRSAAAMAEAVCSVRR